MNQQEYFKKALEVTPWGTQTSAKRAVPGTEDVMPHICTRAKGSHFWDYDKKEYIDFFCSCGPIILGHAYDAIDSKVKEEMDNGFLFSLASDKEYILAKRIVDLFEGTDWVKFLKTGGDATSCAVRVARAYSKKMKVVQSGYHGWHDWYQCAAIGCGSEYGIPSELAKYTVSVPYNDLNAVEKEFKTGDVGTMIVVPYTWMEEPKAGYLQGLRALCDQFGVVLIFDEIKCGFRLGLKGAQGEFGVVPDITTFAKSVCNGYPLSMVCGKEKFKELFFTKAIVTTTYAGETLSMTAALATLDEFENKDIFGKINQVGSKLMNGLREISERSGVPFNVVGRSTLSTILFNTGNQEKNMKYAIEFSRYNFENGMFVKIVGGPSYTLCYSHSEADIDNALTVAESAICKIKD